MKKYLISAAVIATIIVSVSCKEKTPKVLTQEVIFKKEGELSLKKLANDSIIARLNIEIADDEYQTQTGLMYRKFMKDDQAMIFIFDSFINTTSCSSSCCNKASACSSCCKSNSISRIACLSWMSGSSMRSSTA